MMRGCRLLELRVVSVRVMKDGVLFNYSRMRAVQRTKRTGPRTDPCGTLKEMGAGSDV